ncbi:MAG: hypothetical protein JKY14_09505, partial [Paraglaciecola sp.]|nr:hypothetical protein [Paraglaciecola sp.]
ESVSISIFNCTWKQSHSFHIDEGDKIRLNFSLDLDMMMDLGAEDKLKLSDPSWRLINHEKNSLVHEHISAEASTVWVTVAFDENYIKQIINMSCISQTEQAALSKWLNKTDDELIYKEFP